MMRVRSQRGAGTLGCLFVIAVVGAAVYAGFNLALPKLRNSAFEDRINETIVHFAKEDPDYIRKRIITLGEEFHVQLKPENVKVERYGDRLTLDINYEKLVDLKVWQTTLKFSSHRSGTY